MRICWDQITLKEMLFLYMSGYDCEIDGDEKIVKLKKMINWR